MTSNIRIHAARVIGRNIPRLFSSHLLRTTAVFLLASYPAWAQSGMRQVRIEGKAMEPVLNDGDTILVSTDIEKIERGDIVTFWFPDNPSQSFVQRIIGLGGEVIRIDQRGQTLINGRPMDEPYVSPDRHRYPRPIPDTYIKPHYYFVMGDNRDVSNDSRSWGLVPEKYVWGKFIRNHDPMVSPSNAVAGKSFSFVVPPTWEINKKDKDYDPDHHFSIDAADGSFVMFHILDGIEEPGATAQDLAKAYKGLMKNAKSSSFKKWGRYEGNGIVLSGKIMNLISVTTRIFVFNQANKTFMIIEQVSDDEKPGLSPGLRTIEDSFTVAPLPRA